MRHVLLFLAEMFGRQPAATVQDRHTGNDYLHAIYLAQSRWMLEGHAYPGPVEELPPWTDRDVACTLREIRSL